MRLGETANLAVGTERGDGWSDGGGTGGGFGHPRRGVVACAGQQAALVAAINAANTAGGGTINLAPRCHYSLTSSPDNSENGLPAVQFPSE